MNGCTLINTPPFILRLPRRMVGKHLRISFHHKDFWVHTPRLPCSEQAMTVSNSRQLRRSENQAGGRGVRGGTKEEGYIPAAELRSSRRVTGKGEGMFSRRKRSGDWKAPGCASRLPGASAHRASEGSGCQGVPRLSHQGWGGNGFVWQDERQTRGHHR